MLYYLIAAILVVIDQLVKLWVRSHIELGGIIPFIPRVVELTYTQNTGAAFSSFEGYTWLLAIVSLGASVLVAVLIWKNVFPGKWGKLSLTLILAGAVGNLIDRVAFGFVTDMFDLLFMKFAVFNVADICVTIGGVLLMGYALFFWDKAGKARYDGD